ncbi:phosphotransferase [Streptomyces albus]|uniref:phosphotransferase enzyme family protein n=1 Tax=Streptomyces albus TaxID=1888 RepID=UPI0033FA1EC1
MPVVDPLPAAPTLGQLPLHHWDATDLTVVPWPEDIWQTGYNSHTWLLEGAHGGAGDRWVLKAVPREQAVKFRSGLRAADLVERAGIPAGAPRGTRTGGLVAEDGDWCWALLTFVPGRPTDLTAPAELAAAGRTLGHIHAVLRGVAPLPRTMVWSQMDWVLEEQPFLEGREWITQALREGFQEASGKLSEGILHCDPRLTEFRFEGDRVGLLDWGEVMHGPHVFDLAGTLSFVEDDTDPAPFLAGYLETSPASAEELRRLPAMLKVRAAMEGWIYARREYHGVALGQGAEHTNASLIERARENVRAADALSADSYLL